MVQGYCESRTGDGLAYRRQTSWCVLRHLNSHVSYIFAALLQENTIPSSKLHFEKREQKPINHTWKRMIVPTFISLAELNNFDIKVILSLNSLI